MSEQRTEKSLVERMRECWKRIDPTLVTDDPVGLVMASRLLAEGSAELESLADDLRKAECQKERCAGLTAGQWRAFFIQTQHQWQAAEGNVGRLTQRLAQINTLACYASEENTEAQRQALLEIGKLARGEETREWPTI